MRRREFVALLTGAAAAWPLAARAQQPEQMRLVGVLAALAENDPDMKVRLAVFRERLEKLGWSEGRNIQIDIRFAAGRADQFQVLAKELVALKPNVIVAHTTPAAAVLKQATATVPVVFVQVTNPVGAGFVKSLAHPGANITGFSMYEPGMATKWL